LALALLAGCQSAPPAIPDGRLRLELTPLEASVLVDDRPLLRHASGALLVKLPTGAHRVEVYAPGYFHAYRDVVVTSSAESSLKVALRPDPDMVP
jgi:hypothetical protein